MQPQDRRRSSVAPQGRRRSSVAPATRRRSSRWATESSFLDAAGDAGLLGLFDSRVDQDETEPATFSKALADLVARLVHLSARTPDAVRAELRSWRRAHLDALTHEDVVGLVFEELLPSVLSQLVVLKERSKVLSALGVCASVFFMCGDLFSSIGVALKLVFARSIFGYVMFGVLALCVDLSRIPVYLYFRPEEIGEHLQVTLLLAVAALLGVRAGKRWLEAMKAEWIHNLVMAGIVGSGFFYISEAIF